MTWARSGNKFNARKTEVNGIVFDSRREAEHFMVLSSEVAYGYKRDLQLQVRIPLKANGQKVCDYVADFTWVTSDGEFVVADVKSPHTRTLPVYRLKRKLFRANFGVDIVEL